MKILMVYPGLIENLPPLLSSAICLGTSGANVRIICAGSAPETEMIFARLQIEVINLGYVRYPSSRLGKLLLRARFQRRLHAEIRREPRTVWLHGAHAMAYLPLIRSSRRKIVAHCHEIHLAISGEPLLEYSQFRALRECDLYVVPEDCRGWILKGLYRPRAEFVVCPNRLPLGLVPSTGDQRSEVAAMTLFQSLGGDSSVDRLLLYQGKIGGDRRVDRIAMAFLAAKVPGSGLLIMGPVADSDAERKIKFVRGDSKNIVLAPNIPAPAHLQITQGCHAGVITYADNHINNIFCAPNKVFEYAYFGLGMLMPNYPPLEKLVEKYEIGLGVDLNKTQSITEGIQYLLNTPKSIWEGRCSKFLKSVPTPEESYRQVLLKLAELS